MEKKQYKVLLEETRDSLKFLLGDSPPHYTRFEYLHAKKLRHAPHILQLLALIFEIIFVIAIPGTLIIYFFLTMVCIIPVVFKKSVEKNNGIVHDYEMMHRYLDVCNAIKIIENSVKGGDELHE